MTINTSSLVGGSGLYKPVAFTSGQIPTSSTSTLLTDTAAAGQYFKITYLMTHTSAVESGVTLTIDGVAIFSGENLADASPAATSTSSTFGICTPFSADGAGIWSGARLLKDVYCTSFSLVKDVGATSQAINYAYETLEEI